MTTISTDAEHELWCCCPQSAGHSELPELLGRLRQRIESMQASNGTESVMSSGPSGLALAVVTEALAIGEAMSRIAVTEPSGEDVSHASPAVYAGIDSRFVEHRARALRSALHGVDDYVWWGGLAGEGAGGLADDPSAAAG